MRTLSLAMLVTLCACTRKVVSDPGPLPPADHQEQVRAVMNRILKDDGTARYRFAAPERYRLRRSLFDSDVPGQPPKFGHVHGWRVDVFVTAKNTYQRGETPYMAFFSEGKFAGIFAENRVQNAPAEIDKWRALYLPPAAPK
ncbi:MAG TPA: hypothetical protein VFD82_03910 [Planctomycetota bacterium]|nr:hypothetical protein [Planctomycetota bacterium]